MSLCVITSMAVRTRQTKTERDKNEPRPRSVRVPTMHLTISHKMLILPTRGLPQIALRDPLSYQILRKRNWKYWIFLSWSIMSWPAESLLDDGSVLKGDFASRRTFIYLRRIEKKKKKNIGKCVNDLLDFLQPQFSIVTDFQYVATSAQHNKLSSVIA